MFKSKKMLLIWTIILGWSVMSPAMLSVAAKKVGSFVVAAAETSAIKAPPGGRKTGLPKRACPADVVVEPDTADTGPVLDESDMAAIDAALKKARTRDLNKKYYDAHKAEIQAAQKAYYDAHKEERQAAQKAYYDAHKEERQAYYDAHKEERQAAQRAYKAAHKEERQAYDVAYRARKKAEKEAQTALAGAGSAGAAQIASV